MMKGTCPQDLVIYGAGGFGRGVSQIVWAINEQAVASRPYELLGWLDDDESRHGTLVHERPVLGEARWLVEHPDVAVAIGISHPGSKMRVVRKLRSIGHNHFATLVHPAATLGYQIKVGEGTVVAAGVITSADVRIGEFVTLNMACTVGHDVVLDDFVSAAPGFRFSGYVRVGTGAELGTGGAAIQGTTIGAEAIIGAGAVVIDDIPPGATAVGVPAKVIRRRD